MIEAKPLPEDRLTRLEHTLVRLAVLDQRDQLPAAADVLMRMWLRVAQGDVRADASEWAQLLGTRTRLRAFGQTALAHGAAHFLQWLRPQLDTADALYRESTTADETRAAAWPGIAPDLWWYRRVPHDSSLASNYAEPEPLGDLSGLIHVAQLNDIDSWLAIDEPPALTPSADLSHLNLTAADLRDADLSDADLTGARLVGARLDGACLRGARLDGADLRLIDATGVDLSGASLSGARLDTIRLRDSSLTGSNLSEASLRRAYFDKVDASGSRLDDADLRMRATECVWTGASATGAVGIPPALQRAIQTDR